MVRIVVVDRDDALSMTLARVLDHDGLQIDIVGTEAEALAVSNPEPAMVLVRTGADDRVAERVIGRFRTSHPSVPVAVVASEPSVSQERALRRQGILCYLQEPVSDDVLHQVVCGATPVCGSGWFHGEAGNGRGPISEPIATKETQE